MNKDRYVLEEHARLIQVDIARYAADSFGYKLDDCDGAQLNEIVKTLESYEDKWAEYSAGGSMDSLLAGKFEAREAAWLQIKSLSVAALNSAS